MAMEERRVLIEDYELRKKDKVAYIYNMQRTEWERKKQQDKNHKKYHKSSRKGRKKGEEWQWKRASTVEEDPAWKAYEGILDKLNQQLKKIDSLLRQAVHNE